MQIQTKRQNILNKYERCTKYPCKLIELHDYTVKHCMGLLQIIIIRHRLFVMTSWFLNAGDRGHHKQKIESDDGLKKKIEYLALYYKTLQCKRFPYI